MILISALALLLVAGFAYNRFVLRGSVADPKSEPAGAADTTGPVAGSDETKEEPLTFRQKLLADLTEAAKKEDYGAFGDALKKVYENKWENEKEFVVIESDLYQKADKKYFVAGNYAKMLEISTTVYQKAPFSWRFPYLRILTLQRLGLDVFEKGDLATAENMAMEILKMKYRPEGANLLADVYIQRIKTALKDGNTALAKQHLGYIWDFEVSTDRRDTLNGLKIEIDKL